ncbi:MAG: glycosyltransferase family 2 protein [Anaerolineaceae bacterium]|nr:glycosyltransferase family 2 protein [Anaerolineaceae bacterium]
MTELAVIIVTWNVRDLALEALRSLIADLEAGGPKAEIYVVDSASSDGTANAIAQAFPTVNVIASPENLGFVRANNLALRRIGFGGATSTTLPQAVYLLNPDTITQPGATRALYDTLLTNPRLGLVGAQLAYADGSFQHGAFAFPGLRQLWVEFFPTPGRLIEGRFNGRYPRHRYLSSQPFPVDFTLGATMMLRREVIEQVGPLDEGFFMYCEEIDWAWRIKQAGWEVACVPAAHVIHLAGQSTGQARPQSLIHLWTSRLRLAQKHYPAWKRPLARLLIATGMWWKAHTAPPDLSNRDEIVGAYQKIRRMALGRDS